MLDILGDCVIMLFGAGIYMSNIQLQSIGNRTVQVTVNGETVANSRAEEILGLLTYYLINFKNSSETKH